MKMRLTLKESDDGKTLDIINQSPLVDEEEGGAAEEDGGGACCHGDYELMMAVGHVKEAWMEVPGNLVAHIRVGPSYHQRKEASRFIVKINVESTFQ